ncbi:MAG: hypothetical protein ACWIPJ_00160 [Polaribacter sp.]
MKDTFIYKEVWLLTTMGGFQRANLYDASVKQDKNERKAFKTALHELIKDIALTQYSNKVSQIEHIKNIIKVSDFTKGSKFSYLLNNGRLNFGVSQKLLNLYLKYLWCMGKIVTPPHFPVDRIIQEILNKEASKLNIKKQDIIAWTQIAKQEEYQKVILYATKINEHLKYNSLSELELNLFERN